MIEFKEYIVGLFFENTCWNSDNLYSFLCQSSNNILDFHVSKGLNFNISSSPSDHFTLSYYLSLLPGLNGSIAYIFSSPPLYGPKNSHTISINKISQVYHQVQEFKDLKKTQSQTFNPKHKDYLFYGRMYFPDLLLEGLYARKISPTKQFIISYFNNPQRNDGMSLTAQFQHNTSKWSTEYTYSTDDAMFGFRGLWNFGEVPKKISINEKQNDDSASLSNNGQLSIGTEVYYGIFHKIGGLSTALRFTTLPSYVKNPLTMTLTLNPVMGHISAAYSIKAGNDFSLSSRFNFNIFSYESTLDLGFELWRRSQLPESSFSQIPLSSDLAVPLAPRTSIIKLSTGSRKNIRVLWEWRYKGLLCSFGAIFDLNSHLSILKSFGFEFQCFS
ncbi:hypothetical protein MERGE_002166 [Pneumocystis wakefieldiae]|uniref:Mitochondrial distribution and morphology protein 10 n=1 Tax=Pneumocystis wakefieldiae TaxID=38082 RepID=A0A899FXW9_9ASCO|nr:hypothetical protein MERGE_002166 [Pneumocystis wakefieldiae]